MYFQKQSMQGINPNKQWLRNKEMLKKVKSSYLCTTKYKHKKYSDGAHNEFSFFPPREKKISHILINRNKWPIIHEFMDFLLSIWAAITKIPWIMWLQWQSCIFHSLEAVKCNIKVPAGWVSGESLLPGSEKTVFLQCVLTWQKGQKRSLWSLL